MNCEMMRVKGFFERTGQDWRKTEASKRLCCGLTKAANDDDVEKGAPEVAFGIEEF